jgi:hypothetical protein
LHLVLYQRDNRRLNNHRADTSNRDKVVVFRVKVSRDKVNRDRGKTPVGNAAAIRISHLADTNKVLRDRGSRVRAIKDRAGKVIKVNRGRAAIRGEVSVVIRRTCKVRREVRRMPPWFAVLQDCRRRELREYQNRNRQRKFDSVSFILPGKK